MTRYWRNKVASSEIDPKHEFDYIEQHQDELDQIIRKKIKKFKIHLKINVGIFMYFWIFSPLFTATG